MRRRLLAQGTSLQYVPFFMVFGGELLAALQSIQILRHFC